MSSAIDAGQDGPHPPTYIVVASGQYGAVNWTVCKELWDILPTARRERALDASVGVIDPFFVKLVENLLKRVGLQMEVAALVADWSFHEINEDCTYGAVAWQVGQSVWDMMPDDRRENLILLMQGAIHRFFHEQVQGPLVAYATRDLP